MITEFSTEKMPFYELNIKKGWRIGWKRGRKIGFAIGMQRGTQQIIQQLLMTQSPEKIALLTHLPLEKIMQIKNKIEH